eukprot:3190329-Rhodomonas_salina.1
METVLLLPIPTSLHTQYKAKGAARIPTGSLLYCVSESSKGRILRHVCGQTETLCSNAIPARDSEGHAGLLPAALRLATDRLAGRYVIFRWQRLSLKSRGPRH